MPRWEFDIVAEGEGCLERIEKAFEDDPHACVSERYGLAVIAFSIEDGTARQALGQAMDELWALGVEIKAIEPGRLATLSDIATVAGMPLCQAEALASGGTRGPFPRPVERVTADCPLWDMAEVAGWMSERGLFPSRASEFVQAAVEAAAAVEAQPVGRMEHAEMPARPSWQTMILNAAWPVRTGRSPATRRD